MLWRTGRGSLLPTLARTIRIVVAITGIGSIHIAFIESRPEIGFIGLLGLATGNLLANFLTGGPLRERWVWSGVALACALALASGRIDGRDGAYALIAVPFLFNLFLFLVFGGSLLPGRLPVITRLSRLERTRIEPVIERYTRRITGLWALFFAGILGGAAVAFATGNADLASWIINVVSPAGSLTLFVVEHLHRYLRPGIFGPTSMFNTLRLVVRPDAWRPYRHDT